MRSWEWRDLRYFLAIARMGTTLYAARLLGVNQTTCAKRFLELERCFVVDAPENRLCLVYHERLRRRPDAWGLGDAIAEQVNRIPLHLKARGA